jgi:hypothetical protein
MEEAKEQGTEATRLGPIATRILYEDDRVRIWDQVVEPGASIGPHRHELPYALVNVDGSTLEVVAVPGHPVIAGGEMVSVEIESETAGVLPGGGAEDARNTGDQTYRAILVEFKQG